MKSNAAVGYKSKPVAADGKPANSGPAPPLESKKDKTEEENFKEMEEEVHRLLEASADAKTKKNFNEALTKAKEAAAKEKKIRQLREQNNSLD
jgi:intraflagellar transport protein 88